MKLFRRAVPPDVCDRCGHIVGEHLNTTVGCRLCDCPRSPGQAMRGVDPDRGESQASTHRHDSRHRG